MRKRCVRKHYVPGTMLDQAAGRLPAYTAKAVISNVRAKYNTAVEAIRTGTYTTDQLASLINAINMAESIARLGQGADWLPEIMAAQAANAAALKRPRFGWTGPEMVAVYTALDVHDAQLLDPLTTVNMIEEARAVVNRIRFANKLTEAANASD